MAGECQLLTQSECNDESRRGSWHPGADLCSQVGQATGPPPPTVPPPLHSPASVLTPSRTQVNCLEKECGLSGFAKSEPDQWYRFILANFLHTGIVHLVFILAFQHGVMVDVERMAGWWRIGTTVAGAAKVAR